MVASAPSMALTLPPGPAGEKLLKAEISLRRKELKSARDRDLFDKGFEILLTLIRQPVTGMILGVVLCELLERAEIFSSKMTWLLEAAIISGSALSAIGSMASVIKD